MSKTDLLKDSLSCKNVTSNEPANNVEIERSFDNSETFECSSNNAELKTQKAIELPKELREKLNEMPDVIQYIERLQKIIQKQVKKILKWKRKVKQNSKNQIQDATTQTDDIVLNLENESLNITNDEKVKTLADDIREAAEQAIQSTGFVYEETSGLYYDYNSGYYYNAEYGLYYDGETGTYLKYNQDSQSYEFHSQVSTSSINSPTKIDRDDKTKRKRNKGKNAKEPKRLRRDHSDSEEDTEEGECSDSSTSSSETDISSNSESSELCKKWPPCMRMIVQSTDIPKIKPGSLFIITCDGGTIGREGTQHSVCLPDVNVSKHHLKVFYNGDSFKYMITDLGSRNGTLLNGKRISPSKQESEPTTVPHGSKLQIGSTVLLCHIHEGSQTCGHCEPGLLIEDKKDPPVAVGSNKKSINQQYKTELRRLRKQHGLLGSTEETSKGSDAYTDRAQKRRETVGSQNPYEKTQAASLDESITAENKGFKLLSKMGWKEGQSLGKDGTGTLEPIKPKANAGTTGMGSEKTTTTVVVSQTKKNIWKKTQERFEKLPDKKIFDEDDSDS